MNKHELLRKSHEALDRFDRLPDEEQVRRLVERGTITPDGEVRMGSDPAESGFETDSPVFSKPPVEVCAPSAKSHLRPLKTDWRSRYGLGLTALGIAFFVLAVYAAATIKSSSAELAELRSLTQTLTEKVAVLEARPTSSPEWNKSVESRSKALEGTVGGLGARTVAIEKALTASGKRADAIEKEWAEAKKSNLASENALVEARKLQVDSAESLKLARADLEKAQESVKAAAKKIDALAADLGQVSTRVAALSARGPGQPLFSGTQTGRLQLPARYAPESLPMLRLLDVSTKTEGDFPLRPGIAWTLDGKNVPGAKLAQSKGVYDATLTMKYGKLVKVELKSVKAEKE
jgi:hypothetical protein